MTDTIRFVLQPVVLILFTVCSLYSIRGMAAPGVILSAEISEKHVSHIFKENNPNSTDPEFSGDFGSVIIGLTTVLDKFYVNVNSEQSWKDDTAVALGSILHMDRDDYALTLGYALTNSISLFTGYKYGKTGFSNAFLEAGNVVASAFSFKEEGPFIGAAYTHAVSNRSTLSLSMAYADMDGEVDNHTLDAGNRGTGPTDGSGETDGYSVGIKFTNALSDAIQLILGIKSIRYENEGTSIDGNPYEFESEYDYVTLGLSYYF